MDWRSLSWIGVADWPAPPGAGAGTGTVGAEPVLIFVWVIIHLGIPLFSAVMIVLPNKFLTQNNYCREFMEDKITLLTPQFLCETYFQRQQPWGHIINV